MSHIHIDYADAFKFMKAVIQTPERASNEWLDWLIDLAVRARSCKGCADRLHEAAFRELPPQFLYLHPADASPECLDVDGLERASKHSDSKEALHQKVCLRCTIRLFEAVAVSMRAEDRKKETGR